MEDLVEGLIDDTIRGYLFEVYDQERLRRWQRVVVRSRHLGRIRRLWSAMGNYLRMVKERGLED